jgi:hypothetical protein
MGMPRSCTGALQWKEVGVQVWAGLTLSNQMVGSLLRTPWLAKVARKVAES